MRAVLELAGIHDILSKSLGSQNPINLVKATIAGLQDLRTPEEVAVLRDLSVDSVLGLVPHNERMKAATAEANGNGGAEAATATVEAEEAPAAEAPAEEAPAAEAPVEEAPAEEPAPAEAAPDESTSGEAES